jgi:hypothetical protein
MESIKSIIHELLNKDQTKVLRLDFSTLKLPKIEHGELNKNDYNGMYILLKDTVSTGGESSIPTNKTQIFKLDSFTIKNESEKKTNILSYILSSKGTQEELNNIGEITANIVDNEEGFLIIVKKDSEDKYINHIEAFSKYLISDKIFKDITNKSEDISLEPLLTTHYSISNFDISRLKYKSEDKKMYYENNSTEIDVTQLFKALVNHLRLGVDTKQRKDLKLKKEFLINQNGGKKGRNKQSGGTNYILDWKSIENSDALSMTSYEKLANKLVNVFNSFKEEYEKTLSANIFKIFSSIAPEFVTIEIIKKNISYKSQKFTELLEQFDELYKKSLKELEYNSFLNKNANAKYNLNNHVAELLIPIFAQYLKKRLLHTELNTVSINEFLEIYKSLLNDLVDIKEIDKIMNEALTRI